MPIENFDPFKVKKGEKKFGYINIVDTVAAKFDMPIGVVNGVNDGPTLAVTGGLYPTEYCGVESASRLYQQIDPDKLSGRFITIPVMNMSSLQFSVPGLKLTQSSTTPVDRGRINNSFPGDSDGRPTQILAHKVFNILSKAQYHIDFRGGDLNESHLVHTIYLRIGEEIDKTTETMAKVFGLEYVLPGAPEIGHTSPGTMIYELVKSGVASIISESGLGYREQPLEEFINLHIHGTVNIMKHFGMLKGEPTKPKEQRYLDMAWNVVRAPVSGIWTAIADYGDVLKKGGVLGRISDLDGSTISEVKAPIEGVIHTMFPKRVIHKNDPLYFILKIEDLTGW
jgi:predicted deacylase